MPAVLAIAAHPDDIEFLFTGTLLQLAKRGWDLHYMNLCDGSRGSTVLDQQECAATRLKEAQDSCRFLNATFYPPIYADMEAIYSTDNLRKVTAVVRRAKPSIVLTHSTQDYMEDHEIACKLAVSAAFSHYMPNLVSDPPEEVFIEPVTVYHAQPIGNTTPLGEPVEPDVYCSTARVFGVILGERQASASRVAGSSVPTSCTPIRSSCGRSPVSCSASACVVNAHRASASTTIERIREALRFLRGG